MNEVSSKPYPSASSPEDTAASAEPRESAPHVAPTAEKAAIILPAGPSKEDQAKEESLKK